ncbi:MAG: polyphosphate kinase 1 [Synechococcaceae cyanobacterium SM2_3_2]|nr:polyphosphate kinase 1 [Synechococcaceae cyanobacterium SM2_3_2]
MTLASTPTATTTGIPSLKEGTLAPLVDSLPTHLSPPIAEGFAAPELYLNRELSWIQFNGRVLREALDPRTPLLERLKFLAIFSGNLDEFFMVRVAVIKRQQEAGVQTLTPDGLNPQQQLHLIHRHLHPLVYEQHQHFESHIRPELARHGVRILDYPDLSELQKRELKEMFEAQIYPVLTPLAVDPAHPFPYISNLSLSLAVVVRDPETEEEHFARIKVPNLLPRFVQMGETLDFVPLEQVIAHNLESLFVGMTILEYYPFRVTRDADLEIQEDEADDLLEAIQEELRKRRFGAAVRLEIASSTPALIRKRLEGELNIPPQNVYTVPGLLNLGDLMSLMRLSLPQLKDPVWTFATHARLKVGLTGEETTDIFSVIRAGDLLLHHPYESFSSSVVRFLEEAVEDPHVLTIKQTLYRTSGDSPVVNALIKAAENGKQVAVLVELKARFDEENNIQWAKKLEKAGVHVVYGLPGLKIHCKLALVVRQEGELLRRYVHIGTGNYNPKTARLYTDLGILTCEPTLGSDVSDLFNLLTGYSRQRQFRRLLVAPTTLRLGMMAMIRREIDHQQEGRGGRMVIKLNSLVDPKIIALLYEAGKAGVEMDLIVRGMCCLRPGIPGLSESIRVISVVGRLLEHPRIFYFRNGGDEEVYIGSADWMTRNLDRRVETVTPIQDADLLKEIQEILGITLADNRQAWDLNALGQYQQRQPGADEPIRSSQLQLMERAYQK